MLQTQQNAWIHLTASIAVVALAALLRCSALEWALLWIAIGLVWMMEILNTAFETLVDLTTPGQHALAKVAKDVAAAAVLIAALTAALIGVFVLGPKLIEALQLLATGR